MPKPHYSLSPGTNIVFIVASAGAASILLFVMKPHAPISLAIAGAVPGILGGLMQHWSMRQAAGGFSAASSLLEIRSAFKATQWGRRYIRFLYFSKFALLVLAFLLVREPLIGVVIGYFAGFFSLMFAREVTTLRDVFFLQRLSTHGQNKEPDVA